MNAAAAGGGSLGDRAKQVVEGLLSTLGPEDELLLVPYDRTPHPVTPQPSSDLGRLRSAAQTLAPGALATDHLQALAFAGARLAEAHALNRELFWISDFQSVGFAHEGKPARFDAPAGPWGQARVYLVPLAPRSRANAGLTDASLVPSETGSALSVTAASLGAPAGDLAVEVRDVQTGDALGRGFVDLPAQGEGNALLPLARLPELGGVVTIPDDALPLDNRRVFAAGRAGTLRVLLREDGAPSALRFALEAGSPASGLAIETVDGPSLSARIRDADVVVLNDLDRLGGAELQAVLDFWRGGGGLFVVLGSHADPGFWNGSLLQAIGAGTLGAPAQAPAGAAWRLTRSVAGHPVLAGFPARPGEPISSARFIAIRAFTAGAGGRALLEFDRAHPALIEAPHALVVAASLDPQVSDFPVSGVFLPLVHQAVKTLGRGTAAASLLPGERYSAPASTGAWRIEDEQGHEIPSQLVSEAGATRLTSVPLDRPGLYRVVQGGAVRASFAVNPDPRESDLESLSEPALISAFPAGRARVLHPGADLARRVREARYGRELWSWFVILALVLLIAETVIGRWGMGDRAPARAA
jgi:hypothetical protein